MTTLAKLRDRIQALIEQNGENTPIAYTLWQPSDVEEYFDGRLPDNKPLTEEEIEHTLNAMQHNQDAQRGLPEEMIGEEAPDSVKFRLTEPNADDDSDQDDDNE
jgi:hypothetical protein